MIKEWIEKLGLNNKKHTSLYVTMLLLAVVLLVLGRFANSITATGPPKDTENKEKIELITIDHKEELEGILSQIKGVGAVSVMVSYQESSEKILASDLSQEAASTTERSANNNITRTESLQKSDKKVVEMQNQPFVVKEVYATVRGVIVVAEGAGDPNIKRDIIEAVKSVLDVPEHRICVLVKKIGGKK